MTPAPSNKETEASCRQYRVNPECYYEDPCPATCNPKLGGDPTQESCSRYSNIPGCYIPDIDDVKVCGDLPQCEEAAQRGQCLNECWLE